MLANEANTQAGDRGDAADHEQDRHEHFVRTIATRALPIGHEVARCALRAQHSGEPFLADIFDTCEAFLARGTPRGVQPKVYGEGKCRYRARLLPRGDATFSGVLT